MFNRFLTLSFLLLLSAAAISAQVLKPIPQMIQQRYDEGAVFSEFRLFDLSDKRDETAEQFAPKAQFLTLETGVLQQIMAEKPQTLTLLLPYKGGLTRVDLSRAAVESADFSVITSASDAPVYYASGLHYRGIVQGDDNSIAAFSFFSDEVMGLVSDDQHGNRVLGRLDNPGNRDAYIFYSDREVTASAPLACQMLTPEGAHPYKQKNSVAEVDKCVRVYLECDNELYVNKGSVSATVNYLLGAFNQVAALYTNEQINTVVSQIFVWVTPDFYDISSSSTVLGQFRTFRTSFNGDLAHLVGTGGSNLGGIAYLDVLCFPGYNIAYSDINATYSNVPTYSWTVEVMTHEMGHNLGSNHTQWCGWTGGALDNCYTTEGGCVAGPAPTNGGTIMSYCHLTSYGINFNNGFGVQPGDKIRARTAAATCLATACATSNGCDGPVSISVSGISSSSATIAWTSVASASSYTLRYRAVGAASWTSVANAVSPYTINGLPAGDEIEVALRSECGASVSDYQNGVLFVTQNPATCNAPTGLTMSNIQSTSATASWTAVAGAGSYRLSYKLNAATTWSADINVTGTSYNITGLSASSTYNVRVQAVCGSLTSTYSTTTFTTTAPTTCSVPATPTVSNITSTAALVSWPAVAGALSYSLQYRISGTWTTVNNITTNSYQMSGLTPNKKYNVRVRSNCNGGVFSSYSGTRSFTTLSASPGDLIGGETANDAAEEVALAPNPAGETVLVRLYREGAVSAQISLLDVYGRVVESRKQSAWETASFDLKTLSNGVYWVRVSFDEQTAIVKRLLVSHY